MFFVFRGALCLKRQRLIFKREQTTGARQIEKRKGFGQRRVAKDESAGKAHFAFMDDLAYDMCL
jgi:hypothetical protein